MADLMNEISNTHERVQVFNQASNKMEEEEILDALEEVRTLCLE